MKQEKHSQAFLRKRRLLVVLPVLVTPFIALAFWALMPAQQDKGQNQVQAKGLNLQLPNAKLHEEPKDKLSFYEQAERDSLKRAEFLRNDPYYLHDPADTSTALLEQLTQTTASKFNQRIPAISSGHPVEHPDQKIMDRLAELNQQINTPTGQISKTVQRDQEASPVELNNQVDRLQSMMKDMSGPEEADSEIQQLNGTLDKILDIQHPERVKDRLKEKSQQHTSVAFAVSKEPTDDNISLLQSGKKAMPTQAFFGISAAVNHTGDPNAIEAVVNDNQVLVNGSVLTLRLSTDMYINGIRVPRGHLLSGTVALHEERLTMDIDFIRYHQYLFPVKLEVFDLDGLAGIYIPGAIGRDVAKQSADNTLQLMAMSSIDPSLKAQATTAGISAAKSLLSKKVKLMKVSVKAGYQVLLKDKNGQ